MARFPLFAWFSFAAALGLAACHGCRSTQKADPPATPVSYGTPTIRLYAISNLAGALEPCGCTKDQLGGMDHLAAHLSRERGAARESMLVAVGPTMFLDPRAEGARGTQDRWKAEAISASLGDMGLTAWTPGFNDWAGGEPLLAALAKDAKGVLVAANLEGSTDGAVKSAIREVAGVRVGIVGVTTPQSGGAAPEGVRVHDARQALAQAAAEVRAKGAKIVVGLAAVARGEALRLAEKTPELTVLVVGKPVDAGEANDAPPPPVVIGGVLVVGSSNHLQTVSVVDLFVKENDYTFQDATGVANAEALSSLTKRIRELENRLSAWDGDPAVRAEDVAARRIDLAKLREEKDHLANPTAPKSGSFFRYSLLEVREKLGRDDKVAERMSSFYRRVNDHNRTAFAGRLPPDVPPGASGYTGVEACTACHLEARRVWDRTRHAHAYTTLSKQFKEFNLECVSCHVTGYEKPGGSTVTVNEKLQSVQCEECHGAGEAHAKAPAKKGLILAAPSLNTCVSSCHHPPHVEGFDPAHAKQFIVGPGHGLPENAPWPAWASDGGSP